MVDVDTQREAVLAAVDAVAERLSEEKTYLTDLDSVIGDADHGANMNRGFGQVAEKAGEMDGDVDEIVKTVGTTLISEVGGASGPLYGGSIMFASQGLEGGITAESSVAFAEAYRMLKHRISAFVSLPFEKLDALALQKAVDGIGAFDDSKTEA